nr:CDP-alcohol phosphatidyltransferase family protein [Chloroflexota bacterium]
MSASPQHAPDLARGSLVPSWLKQAGRALLDPVVRLALRLRLTPNMVTVIGLLLTLLAATLIASQALLVGAAILTVGSLLDAVDGALARARGGGTAFGGFLDSTLDRAGEAILY